MNNILVFSLITFGFGILFFKEGYWAKYGIYLDFKGIEWLLGPFFIAIGVYFFLEGNKIKKKEKQRGKKIKNLICPKCNQSYPIEKKNPIKQCPKCKLDLLTLDKFLESIK